MYSSPTRQILSIPNNLRDPFQHKDLDSFADYSSDFSDILDEINVVPTVHYFRIVVYGIIFAIGVTANLLVLIVIASDSVMRKKSGTIFTFQLALVDTIMLAFLPFHIHYLKTQAWKFGDIFCRMTNSGKCQIGII